jgi:hypothetical protein
MTDINSKSTINRLLDDLETLAAWKEDLDARIRRADICMNSSVGLSDERLDDLLHEGSAWKRAANGLISGCATNERKG